MANTIRIKRRAAGGSAGAPGSLANAELAFNEQDYTLYYGYGTGGAGGSATSVIAIGGKGAFVDLSSNQTIGGTKTFSSTITGSISGNAGTSSKWAAPITLTLDGDVSGSASFDGSAGATATVTLDTQAGLSSGTYTKVTVNTKGLITAAASATLTDIGSPTAAYSFNSQKITSLAEPTNPQDAATKNYVDSVAQGIDAKASVRCATTANITLSGLQTIDGISVSVDDRVLVKNQSTASQNGIYLAKSGAWVRALDMDAWEEVVHAFTFVELGTTQADTSWVCTSDHTGTLGSTAITWAQFGSASQYLAGDGLLLTGNTFSVLGNGSTINISAAGIKVSDTYAGNSSLTTLGTVATGTWNATVISPTYGGTGVNNGSNTITIGGNISTANSFTTSGNFALTLTTTGVTNVTLPTSGTLATTGVTTLSSLASVGTITTGTWNASIISPTYGGTGINNGSNTITLGGSITTAGTFTTVGAFGVTLTATGTTSITLPTSGTLATTGVTTLSSLASVGTITTGTWNASTIAVAYGGTGATTLTSKGILYGNGTGAVQVTAVGTWDGTNSVGQLLSVDSNGTPTWTNIVDGGTF